MRPRLRRATIAHRRHGIDTRSDADRAARAFASNSGAEAPRCSIAAISASARARGYGARLPARSRVSGFCANGFPVIASMRGRARSRGVGIDDVSMARELAEFFLADRRAAPRGVSRNRARCWRHCARVVKIGMITNGASDIQRAKIAGSGLAGYFDTILVSGEEGFGKPKPEIFRLAIDRLDVDEASAVMIGDSLARDIAGAAERRHQEHLGQQDRASRRMKISGARCRNARSDRAAGVA